MEEQILQKEERISKIRDVKSDLILDAALKAFSQTGIYETKLEDIAHEAGFSKASLYNYYPNKDAIIFHLAVREWENLLEQLLNSAEYSFSQEQTFEENMRRYFILTLKTFARNFNFINSLNFSKHLGVLGDNCESKDPLREFVVYKEKLYEQTLIKALSWATKKEEITPLNIPEMTFCRIIDGIIMGIVYNWICDKRNNFDDIEETANNLINFLINGIKKRCF
ncbi:MAG: TetR/AcrR family transcriptional regulator [Chitinivibrionia bacterium]|nr:TetR/AcrR family transcriptional regulator [Chitinivibrionia bacterium]